MKYLWVIFFLGLTFCSKYPSGSSDSCYDINFSYFVSTSPTDSSYNARAKNVIVKVIDIKNKVISDTTDTLGRFNIIGNLCFPYRGIVETLDGTKSFEMRSSASEIDGCKKCHYPGGPGVAYIYLLP